MPVIGRISTGAKRARDIRRARSALKLLIHTHDTFKGEAQQGVAITDHNSHASLARAYLQTFCDDPDLLAMVQYHDEPFALWRQFDAKGKYNQARFDALLSNIKDWNLFLAFNIIDGCTAGKDTAKDMMLR